MDSREALARDLGEVYGVPWSTRLEEVLQDPRVQAVYIAVPHDLPSQLQVDGHRLDESRLGAVQVADGVLKRWQAGGIHGHRVRRPRPARKGHRIQT